MNVICDFVCLSVCVIAYRCCAVTVWQLKAKISHRGMDTIEYTESTCSCMDSKLPGIAHLLFSSTKNEVKRLPLILKPDMQF